MARKRTSSPRRRIHKVGLPPGTLVHTGEQKTQEVRIWAISYGPEEAQIWELSGPDQCATLRDKGPVLWIDVHGVHDVGPIEVLGKCFGLDLLLLEDVLDTSQRPKVEDYEDYTYVVVRAFKYQEDQNVLVSEQVSLVLGGHVVLSFQEGPDDLFALVKDRIISGKGRIRYMGADYLLYCLLDNVVDGYFVVMERIGDELEAVEESILGYPGRDNLTRLHSLRRDMILVRKALWPLREVLGGLYRGEMGCIKEALRPFFRDVYDHTIEMMDTLETYRDMASALLEVHLSTINNRLNEVMKFLTVVSTIFIPLTFIAGLYGMNFKFMPELEWKWGYPAVLALMAGIVSFMLWYFKKKGWV